MKDPTAVEATLPALSAGLVCVCGHMLSVHRADLHRVPAGSIFAQAPCSRCECRLIGVLTPKPR